MRRIKKSVAVEIVVEMSDEYTDNTGSVAAEASIHNLITQLKDVNNGPCRVITVSKPTFSDF
jgi:pimeloyl-CoA synthetase